MKNKNIVHMTRAQAISHITSQLTPLYKNHEDIAMIAAWILSFVTGKPTSALLINKEALLSPSEVKQLEQLVHEHTIQHKPLQYIFGSVPFLSLDITVQPPILIPRPETEYWCQWLISKLQKLANKNLIILDLCTGSGCIALSLAHAFPESSIYAVDISPQACALAEENAQKNKISNVTILESDLFSALPPIKFDLIVSNPPYISAVEYGTLEESVKRWEDPKALLAEDNGLALICTIIYESPQWLKDNKEMLSLSIPQLTIEIGHEQGLAVVEIFKQAGYYDITVHKDQSDKDRFLTARVMKEHNEST